MRTVGHGECVGDSVWASLRCGAGPDAGCVHPKIMDHIVDHSHLHVANLHLGNSHLDPLWRDYRNL